MATNVLQFPEKSIEVEQAACDVCGEETHGLFFECATCGDKMCKKCDRCSCHQLTDYLAGLRPSLLTRLWRRVTGQ
jgi:hypothetical protein